MRPFSRRCTSSAEALELGLQGSSAGSSSGELLQVADALFAAAGELPPPMGLRARRGELIVAAAAQAERDDVHLGRRLRLAAIGLALATAATAGIAAATLTSSRPEPATPRVSQPTRLAEPSPHIPGAAPEPSQIPRSATPRHADETPDATLDVGTTDLLARLRKACGGDVALPELSGLGKDAAQAVVDRLVATCRAASESSEPAASPDVLSLPETSDLLVRLREACGEQAAVPDLSGLDQGAARESIDGLIETCLRFREVLPPP